MTFDFEKSMEGAWEKALQYIRDGAASLKAWLDWEMTVDDMGRPL